MDMTRLTNSRTAKLRKASQPPLSHSGATPDSERAKRPPLSEPSATGQELAPGDRVECLGNFGKPTGEFGIVERANEDDAVASRQLRHRRDLRRRWWPHGNLAQQPASIFVAIEESQCWMRLSTKPNSGPEVAFEEIDIDLLQTRFWIASGLPTIQESVRH
jgi:hypothetical protein